MTPGHVDILHGDLLPIHVYGFMLVLWLPYLLGVEVWHLVEWVDGHQNVTDVGVDNAFQVPLLQMSCNNTLKHTYVCIMVG